MDGIDLPDPSVAYPEFDRLWVKNLVDQAMEHLSDDPGVAALRLQLDGRSYREIGQDLGCKETDVTNFIHRAKERLRREIERMIAEYSAKDDVSSEITSLRRFL